MQWSALDCGSLSSGEQARRGFGSRLRLKLWAGASESGITPSDKHFVRSSGKGSCQLGAHRRSSHRNVVRLELGVCFGAPRLASGPTPGWLCDRMPPSCPIADVSHLGAQH
eukprot:14881322-Alexandrium_andersonii.AAC.2